MLIARRYVETPQREGIPKKIEPNALCDAINRLLFLD
jgi:hypothetical protein